jgi:putative acetyltransferase
MKIRLEEPGDQGAVTEVERLAFDSDVEPAIVDAVRGERGSFALVAEDGDEVVAHVQLSRAWIGDDQVLALGPIAVHPRRQARGIGSALIRAAMDEARRRGESAVILLGSPAFYPRFGFAPATSFGLRNPFVGTNDSGFVIHEEDFMLAPLDDGARSWSGRVRWHPAFGQPG